MIEQQLTTIGLLMLFSIVGGVLSAKFKQPLVLGLLVVGMLIGPNILNIVNDPSTIELMIEFGAILFLFVIGMEFSLKKLSRIGLKAITISLFKVGIMFFIGFLTTIVIGFDIITATFVGVIFSFSSTVIITNILKQKQLINKQEVPLLIAVLILEDIFGIFALTFFHSLNNAGPAALVQAIQHLVLSLTALIIIYVVVSRFAEKIVSWVTKHAGEEFIMFISLALCAAFAYLGYMLKLSPSAGAFLAGSIISTFSESKKFENSIKPHSLMFTSFFFIAIGTTINITSIQQYWLPLVVLTTAVAVGLTIAIGLTTKLFANFSNEGAVFSIFAMLPPGVFSLLVARESMQLGAQTDLVTITSIIILIMTLLMSILLNNFKQTAQHLSKRKSHISKSVNAVSTYIKTLFEEIEIENLHTRNVKKLTWKYLQTNIISIFIFVISTKVASYFHAKIPKYIILALGLIGIIVFFIRGARTLEKVIDQLVKMLTNLEDGTRIKRTKRTLKKMIYGFATMLIGFFSPLVIYALKLSNRYIIISIVIITIGLTMIIIANKMLRSIPYKHKYTIPIYKKFNFKNGPYMRV